MLQEQVHPVVTLNAETIIGNHHAAFRMPKSEQDALKLELIRQNLAFHIDNNAGFREQCRAADFDPDNLRSISDIGDLPLIPIKTFKSVDSHRLLSVPLSGIDLEIASTGTCGVPSVARRDVLTTTRVTLATFALYREFFGINHGVGLFLCPSPAELPEMGMVKVFNMFSGLLDDRVYVVRDYSFDPQEALDYLAQWADRQTRHVFGPPFLINRLLRFMEQNDLRVQLDPNSLVIMLGGWKRYNAESISRKEFDRKLRVHLGISAENIRDMYGMIESNMLAIECERHRKHVPPWCHISVRDEKNPHVELPAGSTGIIGVVDALSQAYPSYILSDDVGRVDDVDPCPCGRTGQVVTFQRRLRGAEIGCCAVSIERFMDKPTAVPVCE
jgi:long-chain-fatty-acid---luciferin-component ligase